MEKIKEMLKQGKKVYVIHGIGKYVKVKTILSYYFAI